MWQIFIILVSVSDERKKYRGWQKHELFGSVSKCLILAMLSKFFTLMLLHGFKSISALMLHL